MTDNTSRRAAGMQPLEIMGALTVRLIHDLTNHLTVLAGNAQVMEMVQKQSINEVIDENEVKMYSENEIKSRIDALIQENMTFIEEQLKKQNAKITSKDYSLDIKESSAAIKLHIS